MATLPGYISIVFILTTFLTIGILLRAAKATGLDSLASIIVYILSPWNAANLEPIEALRSE